jgi:hypothetical protein
MEINCKGDKPVLTENLKDEVHIHGVLNIKSDLNLKLISFNSAE